LDYGKGVIIMKEKKTKEIKEKKLQDFDYYVKRVSLSVVILFFLVVLFGIDRYAKATEYIQKNQEKFDYFTDFSLVMSDGSETFTQDNFKDYKVTVINGWGDWCHNCTDEMPTLQKLSEEYKDKGLQVVGVVADYYENKDKATLDKSVAQIIDSIGITYPNLVSDERFMTEVEPMMRRSFPGTWVVDSEGNLLDFVSGGQPEENWRVLFDEWLAKVEGK